MHLKAIFYFGEYEMNNMTKIIFTIILLASSIASASPWMPWDNNNNGGDNLIDSWMPWGSN